MITSTWSIHPYLPPSSWGDLFEASTGAAAALTGLTFVAISLNVKELLERGGIAERALAGIVELLGVAIVSIVALLPQSRTALGIELVTIGALLTVTNLVLLAYSVRRRPPGEPVYLTSGLVTTVPGLLCFMVSGVSLLLRSGGGLYWTVGGIVLALIGGVVTAWVLLVEILR